MLKKWQKVSVAVAISVLFLFMCIGFAAVNDDLNIFGSLNVSINRGSMLEPGAQLQSELENYDIQTIIFDNYANQSTALMAAGIADWETGAIVDLDSTGSIRLFYDAESETVFILAEDNTTIYANTDASGMFEALPALKTIWFNNFHTDKTTNMSRMFADCAVLRTVYATSDFEISEIEESGDMFSGCYELVGGRGTRVYPSGATETTQPLDHTYAKIDGTQAGYFTNGTVVSLVYFRSNLLKSASENASYDIKGGAAWFTLSNALDASTVSEDIVRYQIAYYVQQEGQWVQQGSEFYAFPGGSYGVKQFAVNPITVDGVTYNEVRVVANCLSGQMESIEAVFRFDHAAFEVAYRYENGVIYVNVKTKGYGGTYTFTWEDGVIADQSDPNKLFNNVPLGAQTYEVELAEWTEYQFCFFVTDGGILAELATAPEGAAALVKAEHP